MLRSFWSLFLEVERARWFFRGIFCTTGILPVPPNPRVGAGDRVVPSEEEGFLVLGEGGRGGIKDVGEVGRDGERVREGEDVSVTSIEVSLRDGLEEEGSMRLRLATDSAEVDRWFSQLLAIDRLAVFLRVDITGDGVTGGSLCEVRVGTVGRMTGSRSG